jgi:hypothetical protein
MVCDSGINNMHKNKANHGLRGFSQIFVEAISSQVLKLSITVGLALALSLAATSLAQPLPKVAPVDLSKLKPSDFSNDEMELPYYLAHFHRVANSVLDKGEHRGFFDLSVWRGQVNHKTYNARIMENCLSLAFFYCTNRPWNPYYGDDALRRRLEAALDYWCRMQSPDGKFSEYGPQEWNLAAAAFATKFMGETLRLLNSGPPIDAKLHEAVWQAQRKAIMIVLNDAEMWQHGVDYSNQYSNVWAGGLAYLAIRPDAELQTRLRQRIEDSVAAFQSPAGYFYERSGPDWGYNLGTHHSNLHLAWHYTRGTDLEQTFVDKVQRWYEWYSYNAALEPDDSGFTINRGIETRQRRGFVAAGYEVRANNNSSLPQAEKIEIARAFATSQAELERANNERRAALEKEWPKVPSLQPGEFSTFSPYAFLHHSLIRWFPTDEQKAEARKQLPYLTRDRFNHQRADNRHAINFTYIRKPDYYAAFNAGEIISEQQRYGLGLLWHPQAGAVLQSQTASEVAAWGTKSAGDSLVYEARSFTAAFTVRDQILQVVPGAHDLADGELVIKYRLGDSGQKQIKFNDEEIEVTVDHRGAFVETLPLLKAENDEVELDAGFLKLRRGDVTMRVTFEPRVMPKIITTEESPRRMQRFQIGAKQVLVVTVDASDKLTYRIEFDSGR